MAPNQHSGVAWECFYLGSANHRGQRRLDRMEGRDFIAVELGAH